MMGFGHPVSASSVLQDLKRWASGLKRDVHAIYLAARSPRVPWHAKIVAIAVAGYALSPVDLIPDFIPVVGYLDDLIIVPLGILLVLSLIPEEVMAECRAIADQAATRPQSRLAATMIIAIWILGTALLGWIGFAHWARPNQAVSLMLQSG